MVRNVGKLGNDNLISSKFMNFHERLKKKFYFEDQNQCIDGGRGNRWGAKSIKKIIVSSISSWIFSFLDRVLVLSKFCSIEGW